MPVIFIEGMASAGLIEKYWIEECMGGRRVRIHVKTIDGRHLVTKCIDKRGSKRVIHVLAEYMKLSRLIVEE